MDPLSFRAIGDPAAVGTKFGSTAGSETRIIYPQTKLVDDQFKSGRVLTFNWKSDEHAFFHPRSTRLYVEYDLAFGEVNETASDPTTGARQGAAVTEPPRPSPSLRMAALCNSALFDSQVRFVQNAVTVETCPNFYTTSMAMLLLNSSGTDAAATSGSNMLNSLQKSRGIPDGYFTGGTSEEVETDATSREAVVPTLTYSKENNELAEPHTDSLQAIVSEMLGTDKAGDDVVVELIAAPAAHRNLDIVDADKSIMKKLRKGMELSVYPAGGASISDFELANNESAVQHVYIQSLRHMPAAGGVAAHTRIHLDHVLKSSGDATKPGHLQYGAGDNLTFRLTAGDPRGVDDLTLGQFSSLLNAQVNTSLAKDAAPNSKYEIVQQSFDAATGVSHVCTAQPLMLSSWQGHNFAIGPSSFELHLTISPDAFRNFMYDHSGAYGCLEGNGGAISGFIPPVAQRTTGQIYCQIRTVELWTHMIYPVVPYVPKSMSFKYQPFQMSTIQLTSTTVNETVTVPASTRSVALFSRQRFTHICADREELSKAAAGIVEMGSTLSNVAQSNTAVNNYGRFQYDSTRLSGHQDPTVDPRIVDAKASSTTFPFETLQTSLGQKTEPRDLLSQMDPFTGQLARLWSMYMDYLGKGAGQRTAPLSYSAFCGHYNSVYKSAPGCGESGCFYLGSLQNPPGTLATDLQIRGTLKGQPNVLAQQELIVLSISDSLMNIAWTPGNNMATLTETNPIV